MKRGSVVLFALGCLGLAQPAAVAQSKGRAGEQEAVKQGWIFNLAQGKAEARKTGKPLMVVLRCVP